MRQRIAVLAGAFARLRLGRPRTTAVTIIQLAGLGAVVYGVALVSLPAALIIGGIGAVLWSQGVDR